LTNEAKFAIMTPLMNKTNRKNPVKSINQDSLIEQLKSLGSGVVSSVKSDVVSGIGSDALSSLFGSQPTPKQGELTPGEPINLGNQTQQETVEDMPFMPRPKKADMFSDYISNEALNKLKQNEAQMAQKIEEIRFELRALIKAIKNVDKSVESAASQNIVDPGQYHLDFLDRLKTVLKVMRQNLNHSSTWLNALKSRKKERSYWKMYKKKGTSFGLSNERSVSTQVG